MKKVMLVGVMMMMFAFVGNTQVVVNEVNINELDIKYIELVGKAKLNPTKIKVILDYGQPFSWKSQAIRGVQGDKTAFNSMIDALNFLEANGWEFVSNYVVSSATEVTTRYILRKASK
jgi:hypothetical protein